MKQELIAGMIICMIGLALLFIPADILWRITEKWKTKGGEQPAKSYVILIKVLGIVFTGVGGGLLICG